MQDWDDNALLREYAANGSEEAFALLVERHVNKVYSVALRHTGNPNSAEEITQAVFVILARKARHLRKGVILSGWLYQTARLTAVTLIRSEIRRARREEEAQMQTTLNDSEAEAWRQIAPLLDAAMADLNESDRHAIVLRFFDGRSMREVGDALGANEDAAKKRVSRAVEKLRQFFTRRGVALSATAVTAAISAHSVQAAPAVLTQSITTIALAKGATASASTSTLIQGALKIMAWTKAKTAVAVGIGILLAAGTTTVTVKEIQEHRTYSWQVPQADFGVFYKTPPQVKIVPTKFSADGAWCSDGTRGAMGIAQPLAELIHVAYQKDKFRTFIATDLPTQKYDFFAKLATGMARDAGWANAMQQEIKRKFGIAGHMENRETDVLLLKPASGGVRNVKVSKGMPKGLAMMAGAGKVSFVQQPMSSLASYLEQHFQIPVVDQTGLTGEFDFAAKWSETDMKEPNLEGLKAALHDQLGLDLVSSRETIEMLVVERAKN